MSKLNYDEKIQRKIAEVKRHQAAVRNSAKTVNGADAMGGDLSITARVISLCGWLLWGVASLFITALILVGLMQMFIANGLIADIQKSGLLNGLPLITTNNIQVILSVIVMVGAPWLLMRNGMIKSRRWQAKSLRELVGLTGKYGETDAFWSVVPSVVTLTLICLVYLLAMPDIRYLYNQMGVPYSWVGVLAIIIDALSMAMIVLASCGFMYWVTERLFGGWIMPVIVSTVVAAALMNLGQQQAMTYVMGVVLALSRMKTGRNYAGVIFAAFVAIANYSVLMIANVIK